MDKANSNIPEENTSARDKLYEFDFDEILTDDINQEPQHPIKQEEPTADDPAVWSEVHEKAEAKRTKRLKVRRGFKTGYRVSVVVLTWVKDIAVALLVIWVLTTFAASFIKVADDAMFPTLEKDERIVVIKFRYRFSSPERDEIIVFKDKTIEQEEEKNFFKRIIGSKDGATLISRVIGLPGDTIVINPSGAISVNGVPLITDYCDGMTTYVPGQMTYPVKVPEDCYFVLSDNPSSTGDSRFQSVGLVSKEDIVGEVFCVYWPRAAWRPVR